MGAPERMRADANWHPDEIRSDIPVLSLSLLNAPLAPTLAAYNAYYGLNLELEFSDLKHAIGRQTWSGFEVCCHLFKRQDPKGTVLLVHGYYDHVGLYREIIRHCLDQGYDVLCYDLPGHGLSSGELAAIQSFRQYDEVFQGALDWLQTYLSGPIVVMGQSTGGAVIINYLLSRGLDKQTSPFAKIYLLAPLVRPVNWKMSKLFYYLARPFVKQLKREFAQNSHNQDFLDFLKQHDPLQPLFLKTQWVGAMKKWIRFIEALPQVDLDIHVIQGTDDGTVDYRHNMLVLERKFSGFQVTFVEQGRHHLANEEPIKLQQVKDAMTPLL